MVIAQLDQDFNNTKPINFFQKHEISLSHHPISLLQLISLECWIFVNVKWNAENRCTHAQWIWNGKYFECVINYFVFHFCILKNNTSTNKLEFLLVSLYSFHCSSDLDIGSWTMDSYGVFSCKWFSHFCTHSWIYSQ